MSVYGDDFLQVEFKSDRSELLIVPAGDKESCFSVMNADSAELFKGQYEGSGMDALVRFAEVSTPDKRVNVDLPTLGQMRLVERNIDSNEDIASVFNKESAYWVRHPRTNTKYIKDLKTGRLSMFNNNGDEAKIVVVKTFKI